MELITDPEAKITGCGGWAKIKGSGSLNRSRIGADEGRNRKDERRRPDTFRVIRLLKVSALCFHSFLITPWTSQLSTGTKVL